MITRHEMPDGRLYDVDDQNVIWHQKVSEAGAGTNWQECARPGDPEYGLRLTDILMRGKQAQTWEA